MTKFKAGFDRVLCVEPEEIKQSAGGIFLPNGTKENQVRCKVVEVGPINEFKGDTSMLSAGDTIIVSQYAGATFMDDDNKTKYRSVELKDIIAVIKPEETQD